ncbi:hypothetical protein [Terrihabitans sp. B22-R8]|uniref:hypothetical protein n=1 Tax=Terrihabitans sp. B22-R8 TaxID=3425128 RepID=UPI00403C421A
MKTVLLIVLVAAVALGGLYGLRKYQQMEARTFNKERWIAQAGVQPSENRRSVMKRDLESRLSTGMREEQIIDLMGPPDQRAPGQFSYSLGMPGFGVDYASFIVEFDDEGRMTRYYTDQG